MLTRPEAADPALEDLKRRARRRLVGAVVLALAAVVILPLLLESDPKPLGEDVSIQIPPIDSGKFITPLSPAMGPAVKAVPDKSPAPVPSAASASPAPPAPVSDAAFDTKASAADASKPAEPAPGAPTDATPVPAPLPSTSKPAGPTTSAIDAQKPAADATRAADATTHAADSPTAAGFVVQLAALADAKAAAAMASKLKSAGFPAYTETLKSRQGTVRRVRVGPYPAREAADAERVKLSAAGYHGVVTAK